MNQTYDRHTDPVLKHIIDRDEAKLTVYRESRPNAIRIDEAEQSVRGSRPSIFRLPGKLGEGLVALIEDVESSYALTFSEGIENVAWLGAHNAGYRSDDSYAGPNHPITSDDDAIRWLLEPAPRYEVLKQLCDEIGMEPPSRLARAIERAAD